MSDTHLLVELKNKLTLRKTGLRDLNYDKGTLLKVLMVANQHIVVEDEDKHTFILDNKQKGELWEFL